jgi:hypothetical protein
VVWKVWIFRFVESQMAIGNTKQEKKLIQKGVETSFVDDKR